MVLAGPSRDPNLFSLELRGNWAKVVELVLTSAIGSCTGDPSHYRADLPHHHRCPQPCFLSIQRVWQTFLLASYQYSVPTSVFAYPRFARFDTLASIHSFTMYNTILALCALPCARLALAQATISLTPPAAVPSGTSGVLDPSFGECALYNVS